MQRQVKTNRRQLIFGAGAGMLLMPLAACQTSRSVGGAGVSASAAPLVSRIRSSHDVGALHPDGELENAALTQAGFMAGSGRMVHRTGFGKDFASRITEIDTRGVAAENIAHGRFDVARVIDVWMHSPPHRRNMLDPRFSRYGLAYAPDPAADGRRFWAMILAA